MEIPVQIISRTTVKPSSPTPQHLKRMKLSYLDQLMTPVYVPLIFFYQADESKGLKISNQARICQQMKQSLSDILTTFYPLAGLMEENNLTVDCCDAGVEFVEARCNNNLSNAIDSTSEELKQYCPMDHGERHIFNVQLTLFDCGGLALGVYYSHKITDCNSLMIFLNAWAATCRGERQLPQPVNFDLANHFPARELPSSNFWGDVMSEEKLTVRKFVFNREILTHLRKEFVSSGIKDPTRVELISAFVWKHFAETDKLKNPNSTKTFATLHAVNLRGRKEVLENMYGNCIMSAFSFADAVEDRPDGVGDVHDLVSKLRRSIRRFDENYITEARSGNNYIDDLYKAYSKLATGEVELCVFTSWCRCPIYDIDYGFGGPLLFRTPSSEMKNTVLLASSKFGDNIDAWICSDQNTLEMLQTKINVISH